jgi:hypothetical protein
MRALRWLGLAALFHLVIEAKAVAATGDFASSPIETNVVEKWSPKISSCETTPCPFSAGVRRAEAGHHHHVAGPYLLRYAQEASWREDHRWK